MATPTKRIPKTNASLTSDWRSQLSSLQDNKPYVEQPLSVSTSSKESIRPIKFGGVDKNDSLPTPANIKITDTRKIRATTGKPMDPNRDYKTGTYPTKTATDIIRAAKTRGADPWTALAIGSVETGLGKLDSDNPGMISYSEMDFAEDSSGADDLVYTMQQKKKYAKNLGYNDELHQIQAYNGFGKISRTNSDSPQKSYYGVPVPPGGHLDFKKNPLYAKEVIDHRENILKKNKDMQNMVDTVGSTQKIIVNPTTGMYNNMNKSNTTASNVANWLNKNKKK